MNNKLIPLPDAMILAAIDAALREHESHGADVDWRERTEYIARVAVAAALAECEVREQWRYLWSDGGQPSAWFDGKPQHLGREFMRRGGAVVTSVAADRRLVITTPAAVDTPAHEETA